MVPYTLLSYKVIVSKQDCPLWRVSLKHFHSPRKKVYKKCVKKFVLILLSPNFFLVDFVFILSCKHNVRSQVCNMSGKPTRKNELVKFGIQITQKGTLVSKCYWLASKRYQYIKYLLTPF